MRCLLTDGSVVHVRELRAADRDAVTALHRDLPEEDHYPRFLAGATDARIADGVLAPGAVTVGAFRNGALLGVAHYRPEPDGRDPELVVAVARPERGRGVASLLVEQIVAVAAEAGVARLRADVLAVNHAMLRVLRDSGLPISSLPDGAVRRVVITLPRLRPEGPRERRYRAAVLTREVRAEGASLRTMVAPRSVAVIGAGRTRGSVGRAVLDTVVAGGFTGTVHAVNPHASAIGKVRCVPSAADLPRGVDLAVLCVPAPEVPAVAEQCGRRGVRSLLVISSGVGGKRADMLWDAVERYDMRLAGPNCGGLVNTDPAVRLQATFGSAVAPGVVGVVTQSGGVAAAVAAALARLGSGVSTAVSVGDAFDVSVDDLLEWWSLDERTRVAVVHAEALPRPRRLALLAARLARRIPVIALRSGSSPAGQRAAAAHSAATATPSVLRDALLAQAGVLAVDGLSELSAVTALLCAQPLPAGPRVAVVGNAGGVGVLAADACDRQGLWVRALLAVALDQAEVVTLRGTTVAAERKGTPGACAAVPVYADPAMATRALAAAVARGRWLRRADGLMRRPHGIREAVTRTAVADVMQARPEGGWLGPAAVQAIAKAIGLPIVPGTVAHDEHSAIRAWHAIDGPVAIKADVPGVVHKARRGGRGRAGHPQAHRPCRGAVPHAVRVGPARDARAADGAERCRAAGRGDGGPSLRSAADRRARRHVGRSPPRAHPLPRPRVRGRPRRPARRAARRPRGPRRRPAAGVARRAGAGAGRGRDQSARRRRGRGCGRRRPGAARARGPCGAVDPVAARVGLSGWPAEAAGRARTRAPWQRPSGPSGGGGRPGRARPRGPRFCCRIRRRTSGAPRTIGRRSRVVGPCPAVRGRPTMTEDRGRDRRWPGTMPSS